MIELEVSLDRIVPNPWQTRPGTSGEDDAHVVALAEDIVARGLLQSPLGRIVNPDGGPVPDAEVAARRFGKDGFYNVQLAFGHHRLAAFRLLSARDHGLYGHMPVRIAQLSDAEMALAAWSENAARKNLSPIEEARALQRIQDSFSWSAAQVAEHVGLSRSAVANKLRLLRLPEELQEQMAEGAVSERQGLALLPVQDLPAAAQERLGKLLEEHDGRAWAYDQVMTNPAAKSAEQIREAVKRAIDVVTLPLLGDKGPGEPACFPLDSSLLGVEAPACRECENLVGNTRCADPACAARKQAAWEEKACAAAVRSTGIPFLPSAEYAETDSRGKSPFGSYGDDPAGLQKALAERCPNLRLVYYGMPESKTPWPARLPAFPEIAPVCVRDKGPCRCAKGEIERKREEEMARQRERDKEVRAIRDQAARELAAAIERQEVPALRAILRRLVRYEGSGEVEGAMRIPDAGTLREKIARAALDEMANFSADAAKRSLADWRKKVGWLPAEETNHETQ